MVAASGFVGGGDPQLHQFLKFLPVAGMNVEDAGFQVANLRAGRPRMVAQVRHIAEDQLFGILQQFAVGDVELFKLGPGGRVIKDFVGLLQGVEGVKMSQIDGPRLARHRVEGDIVDGESGFGHGLDVGALRLVVGQTALAGLGVFHGDLQVFGSRDGCGRLILCRGRRTAGDSEGKSQENGAELVHGYDPP